MNTQPKASVVSDNGFYQAAVTVMPLSGAVTYKIEVREAGKYKPAARLYVTDIAGQELAIMYDRETVRPSATPTIVGGSALISVRIRSGTNLAIYFSASGDFKDLYAVVGNNWFDVKITPYAYMDSCELRRIGVGAAWSLFVEILSGDHQVGFILHHTSLDGWPFTFKDVQGSIQNITRYEKYFQFDYVSDAGVFQFELTGKGI